MRVHSPSLYLHSLRVAHMAQVLAPFFGLDGEEAFLSGLFHDAGKLCLPQELLHAARPLTEEEKQEMRRHTLYGARLVREVGLVSLEVAVLSHHERWDGLGYPRGLCGPHIPPLARFLALLDAYDAMTEARPYRKPFSPGEALREIFAHAGSQFDPGMARVFAEVFPLLAPPSFGVSANGGVYSLQVSRIPDPIHNPFGPGEASDGSVG